MCVPREGGKAERSRIMMYIFLNMYVLPALINLFASVSFIKRGTFKMGRKFKAASPPGVSYGFK